MDKKVLGTIIITVVLVYSICCSIIIGSKRGCMDKNAINYNCKALIHNQNSCQYDYHGCYDPSFDFDCRKPRIKINQKKLCEDKNAGCLKNWAANYNSYSTVSGPLCLGPVNILNRISVLSSKNSTTVVVDDYKVIDGGNDGFNCVVIGRGKEIDLKTVDNFDIFRSMDDLHKLKNLIVSLKKDDIIILASKGPVFENVNQICDLEFLREVGSKAQSFTVQSNYILIGSKKGDIYFESISDVPTFFPFVEITESECKVNPTSLFPPKEYVFFKEATPNDEARMRCALEAHIRGRSRFGILDDMCIPMTEEEYRKQIMPMKRSAQCFNTVGNKHSINVYKFDTYMSNDKLFTDLKVGVYLFSMPRYEGRKSIVYEGEHIGRFGNVYSTLKHIRSIIVPDKYFVYLILRGGKFRTIIGPQKIDELGKLSIDRVIVKRFKSNSVLFCENKEGTNNCYVFEPGKYTLPTYMYAKIKFVNMGPAVNEIYIFSDVGFSDLIESFEKKTKKQKYEVKYPQIVRSIVIL